MNLSPGDQAALELIRVIAERLGWTSLSIGSTWYDGEEGSYEIPVYRGMSPHGYSSTVPRYAFDLRDAIMLRHDGAFLDLIVRENGECIAAYLPIDGYRHSGAKDASAALAICKAWIAEDDKRKAVRR